MCATSIGEGPGSLAAQVLVERGGFVSRDAHLDWRALGCVARDCDQALWDDAAGSRDNVLSQLSCSHLAVDDMVRRMTDVMKAFLSVERAWKFRRWLRLTL